MSTHRHLPVRPDLTQLKHQAKELLTALHAGVPTAIAELRTFHPKFDQLDPSRTQLSDAQLTLARAYGVPSWPRLVLACELIDAIWRGDLEAVRGLIEKHPSLLKENARGTAQCNWGPALSYAANVGQEEIVQFLHNSGANGIQHAFERACLRGKLETARRLHSLGARPQPGSVMGPCETLSAPGLALQLELGTELVDEHGNRLAPLALVLETYSRNPDGKQAVLDIFVQHGYPLPDTAVFAVHRGRIDLLAAHVQRAPSVLTRQFAHEEIYPPELGCHTDHTFALCGTPLAGGTLLHLAVDDDAYEVAKWLLENGADVNAPAAIDTDGFGGHTALFGCVVSQAYRCSRPSERMTQLLLDHGANTTIRVNLRKALRFVDDETLHEYFDVTPRTWGERFHDQDWVNPAVLALLAPASP
ncbi:ankyrin repeat domain-containing protein [Armatimonas sp.]|uniref:ankyrin repeat domain-containing protein n=1 Tax=Armatimonas sp. TaxID=1872638 RepID=UPI00374D4C54